MLRVSTPKGLQPLCICRQSTRHTRLPYITLPTFPKSISTLRNYRFQQAIEEGLYIILSYVRQKKPHPLVSGNGVEKIVQVGRIFVCDDFHFQINIYLTFLLKICRSVLKKKWVEKTAYVC